MFLEQFMDLFCLYRFSTLSCLREAVFALAHSFIVDLYNLFVFHFWTKNINRYNIFTPDFSCFNYANSCDKNVNIKS